MLPENRGEEVVSRNVSKRNEETLLLPAYGEVGNWRNPFASTSDVLSRRIAPRFLRAPKPGAVLRFFQRMRRVPHCCAPTDASFFTCSTHALRCQSNSQVAPSSDLLSRITCLQSSTCESGFAAISSLVACWMPIDFVCAVRAAAHAAANAHICLV